MSKQIVFGSGSKRDILEELEGFRKAGKIDQLITRAMQTDSNVLLLHEVLTCVENGPQRSRSYKGFFKELSPALQRAVVFPKKHVTKIGDNRTDQPTAEAFPGQTEAVVSEELDELPVEREGALDRSRTLGPFLFEEDVLPGNGKAESLCASPDGCLLAYTTWAAAPLQGAGERRFRSTPAEMDKEASIHATSATPKLVNIVSFDPYDAWSISVAKFLPERETASLELVGLDHERLYAIQSIGIHKRLLDVDIHDGTLQGRHELCDQCGAHTLDVEAKRITFIDTVSGSLNILSLSDDTLASHPLALPSGLNAKDLCAIALNQDGTIGIILVAPRSDSSGVLMAIVRMPFGEESTIRWFKRKELWLDKGFETCRLSLRGLPRGCAPEAGAFYLIDATNTIYSLPLATIADKKLEEIDPAHLLSPILASKGGRKALFPVITVGAERPLMVTYEMTTEQLSVWDTSTDCLLMTIPCPVHLERLELVAHDTLLIAKSRAMDKIWASLTVTFVDFVLLCGQAPTAMREECIPLLEPLAAWAPDNQLLDFMRRLITLAGEEMQEASA